ncbi:MBL fold metallo-hydrolase [bacterium]|nr:MAG: MBL fold metallo-hydrolase [bacterium]
MPSDFYICVLGSGSKGNCVYLRAGGVHFLVDAGLRYNEVENRLRDIDVSTKDIQHVFITHEHIDHISGLKKFAKNNTATVHVNAQTYLRVSSELPAHYPVNVFDTAFEINDIRVTPFAVSHDAVDPMAFSFSFLEKKISVVTDTGYATNLVKEQIKNSDVMVLECNHDEEMLKKGIYPWPLKQRIAGKLGHLSNLQAAQTLAEVTSVRLRHVFLAHLSAENNSPKLALETVGSHFSNLQLNCPALIMTHQSRVSELVSI